MFAAAALFGEGVVAVDDDVVLFVGHHEAQLCVMDEKVRCGNPTRLVVSRHERKHMEVHLEPQQLDGFLEVGSKDEIAYTVQFLGEDLGVDKCHADQIVVLQFPDIDLVAQVSILPLAGDISDEQTICVW